MSFEVGYRRCGIGPELENMGTKLYFSERGQVQLLDKLIFEVLMGLSSKNVVSHLGNGIWEKGQGLRPC